MNYWSHTIQKSKFSISEKLSKRLIIKWQNNAFNPSLMDKKVNLTSKGFHTPEREELLLSSQRPLNTAYKDAYLSTYLPKPANFLS